MNKITDQDYVNDLAFFSSGDGKNVCFAARRSGSYRSDDGGYSWRNILKNLNHGQAVTVTCVALSPEFNVDHTVFAGTERGVLKSVDGGESWGSIPFPSPASLITALAISPDFKRDGFVIASTLEDGMFRSVDRGKNWNAWNINLLDHSVLCVALSPNFSLDETIFIGTETGVFYSCNGGRSWREADFFSERNALKFASVLSLAVSPSYAQDGTLFAGTESDGLWISNNRGKSWKCVNRKAIKGPVNCIVLSPSYPAKEDILVVHNTVLLISRDNGKNWSHWPGKPIEQTSISAVLALNGIELSSPLLLGLTDGNVIRV